MGYEACVSAPSPPLRVASSPVQSRAGRYASPLTRRGSGHFPSSASHLSSAIPAMRLPLLTALLRGGSPARSRPAPASPHGPSSSPRRRAHSARAGQLGYGRAGSSPTHRPATPRSLRQTAAGAGLTPEELSILSLGQSVGSRHDDRPQSPRVHTGYASTPRATSRGTPTGGPLVVHLPQRRAAGAWTPQRQQEAASPRADVFHDHHTHSQFAAVGLQGLHTPLRGGSPPTPLTAPHKQRSSGASSGLNSSAETDRTVGYSDTPSPLTGASDDRDDERRVRRLPKHADHAPLTPTSAPRRAPSPKHTAAEAHALRQRLAQEDRPGSPFQHGRHVWSRADPAAAALAAAARRGRDSEPREERRPRALSAHAGRSSGAVEKTRQWLHEITRAHEAAARIEAAAKTPPQTPSRASGVRHPEENARIGSTAAGVSHRVPRATEAAPSPRFSAAVSPAALAAAAAAQQRGAAAAAAARRQEEEAAQQQQQQHAARRTAHVPSSVSNMVCTWTANGQEDQNKYGAGGYLRIRPGDVLHGRYHVVGKLGWGEFATVWLVWDSDTLHRNVASPCKQFAAVKVSKCAVHVANATRDEASLLSHIGRHSQGHGANSVGRMNETFTQKGEYGDHVAMVFPVLGQNILCLVEQAHRHRERLRHAGPSGPKRSADEVRFMKACLRATLRGLAELHRLQIVHTDLKPENILLTAVSQKVRTMMRNWQEETERSGKLKWEPSRLVQTSSSLPEEERDASYVRISDFGLSSLLDPAHQSLGCGTHARRLQVKKRGVAANPLGVVLQTREYRAPEVLFGSYIGVASDVWSVGCMAYELATGTFLMDPKKDPKRRPKPEEEINADHLCMMQQLIGAIPSSVPRTNGRHIPKYFDSEGRFRYRERAETSFPRRSLKQELLPFLNEQDATDLAHFIQMCLFSFDPFQRPAAEQLLKHNFVRA